jgi:hypothetical protein
MLYFVGFSLRGKHLPEFMLALGLASTIYFIASPISFIAGQHGIPLFWRELWQQASELLYAGWWFYQISFDSLWNNIDEEQSQCEESIKA